MINNKCAICGADCFHYKFCRTCLRELKKKAKIILNNLFDIQYELYNEGKEEECTEKFKEAIFETMHNYCYTPLTEEKHKKYTKDFYIEDYYETFVGIILEDEYIKHTTKLPH